MTGIVSCVVCNATSAANLVLAVVGVLSALWWINHSRRVGTEQEANRVAGRPVDHWLYVWSVTPTVVSPPPRRRRRPLPTGPRGAPLTPTASLPPLHPPSPACARAWWLFFVAAPRYHGMWHVHGALLCAGITLYCHGHG